MRVKCPCRCTASTNFTSSSQQDSFYAARLPILVCFFLRLTVFTKDSIKEDECGSYRAAVFVYAFVCLWHGTVVSRNWCERQKWLVVYKVVKAYNPSYGMVHTFRVTYEVQRLCLEMLYAVNLSLNLLVQNWFTVLFIFLFFVHVIFFFFFFFGTLLVPHYLKWRHWYPLWNTIAMF